MPFLLVCIGILFGLRYKFFYIVHPLKAIKSMLRGTQGGFKALCLALAGTLGVGNIVGVSSAIIAGGYGAVFWMWVSALCAMSLKYAEVFLAMRYRREENGEYHGGAPYYIFDGMKKKIGKGLAFFLSCTFALLCVINSLTTGNLVQVNAVGSLLPVSPLVFGIAFTILAFIIIMGGEKRISSFNSYLIPILSCFYIAMSIYIIVTNASEMPRVFSLIFSSAFSFKSALGGALGYGVSRAIRFGVSRGVLSNEAGCGTSVCAHASSKSNDAHAQGCLGIFEVFFDTIILCSLTAFVIILAGEANENSPMSLVLFAFSKFCGGIGYYGVIISSLLFAFATVCTQYFYGVESLSYITKARSSKNIFTLVFLLVLTLGATIPMNVMWEISDFTLALMTILNLTFLLFLFKDTKI